MALWRCGMGVNPTLVPLPPGSSHLRILLRRPTATVEVDVSGRLCIHLLLPHIVSGQTWDHVIALHVGFILGGGVSTGNNFSSLFNVSTYPIRSRSVWCFVNGSMTWGVIRIFRAEGFVPSRISCTATRNTCNLSGLRPQDSRSR